MNDLEDDKGKNLGFIAPDGTWWADEGLYISNAEVSHLHYEPERKIRVFVSSTFKDFQLERDELVKRIFPILHRLCMSRYIHFSYVDLRWGITNEESSENKVVPLCFQHIKDCRPFFIGMLGERYGWIPEANTIPEALLVAEPWINDCKNCSVTELEILHGVLNSSNVECNAFFYFRDKGFVDKIENKHKKDFSVESGFHAKKIKELKEKIREHYNAGKLTIAPKENYKTPEEFGNLVLQDFVQFINENFPKWAKLEEKERIEMQNKYFLTEQLQLFVGRENYIQSLTSDLINKDAYKLILWGESGIGKTALVAKVIDCLLRDQLTNSFHLFYHFVGSVIEGNELIDLCKRLINFLHINYGIKEELLTEEADDDERWLGNFYSGFDFMDTHKVSKSNLGIKDFGERDINKMLAERFDRISNMANLIIIIDGIDNFYSEHLKIPSWFPNIIHPNIKVIFTTNKTEDIEYFEKKGWESLEVVNLQKAEVQELARKYFTFYSKSLAFDLIAKFYKNKNCQHPLFLVTILNELRKFGDHEKLSNKISELTHYISLSTLFEGLLNIWQVDFNEPEETGNFVKEVLCHIEACPGGISEFALISLIAPNRKDGEKRLIYFLSTISLFVNYNQRHISFTSTDLQSRIHGLWERDIQEAKANLIDYFENPEKYGLYLSLHEKVNKLHQLYINTSQWDKLYSVYSDLDRFNELYSLNPTTFNNVILELEKSGYRVLDQFKRAIENFDYNNANKHTQYCNLGNFFFYFGHEPRVRDYILKNIYLYYKDANKSFDKRALKVLADLCLGFADDIIIDSVENDLKKVCDNDVNINIQAKQTFYSFLIEQYEEREQYDKAIILQKDSLAFFKEYYGETSLEYLKFLKNLAYNLSENNKLHEAIELLEKTLALAIKLRISGRFILECYHLLAVSYSDSKLLDKSIDYNNEALKFAFTNNLLDERTFIHGIVYNLIGDIREYNKLNYAQSFVTCLNQNCKIGIKLFFLKLPGYMRRYLISLKLLFAATRNIKYLYFLEYISEAVQDFSKNELINYKDKKMISEIIFLIGSIRKNRNVLDKMRRT